MRRCPSLRRVARFAAAASWRPRPCARWFGLSATLLVRTFGPPCGVALHSRRVARFRCGSELVPTSSWSVDLGRSPRCWSGHLGRRASLPSAQARCALRCGSKLVPTFLWPRDLGCPSHCWSGLLGRRAALPSAQARCALHCGSKLVPTSSWSRDLGRSPGWPTGLVGRRHRWVGGGGKSLPVCGSFSCLADCCSGDGSDVRPRARPCGGG